MPEDEDCFGEYEENSEECQDCDEIEACKERTSHIESKDNPINLYVVLLFAIIYYFFWKPNLLMALFYGLCFSVGLGAVQGNTPFVKWTSKNLVLFSVVIIVVIFLFGFFSGVFNVLKPPGESDYIIFYFIDEVENKIEGVAYLDNETDGMGVTIDGLILFRSQFEDGRIYILIFDPKDGEENYTYKISKELLSDNNFFYFKCPLER